MYIKKEAQLKDIKETGKRMGEVLAELESMIKPGISAFEVDERAEKFILKAGGKSAFKGYKTRASDPPFPSVICASINEEIVHGIATKDKILKDGDIFSIDIGMWFKNAELRMKNAESVVVDTAVTVFVGKVDKKTRQLVDATREALEVGIAQCVPGNTVADIGKAIEAYVKPFGYGIVRDLVGHGTGNQLHEEPRVPNYYDKELEEWELRPGVVLAIEPMLTIGRHEIVVADDGWSISTADGSMSAHFEHTVIITDGQPIVATRRPGE